MTRFLLTLDQAVDTTFTAIREAQRGEIYVPNAPAATVMNLAQSLVGDRGIEIKVVGIRPGEKLHEIMVSEEEANHTVKRGDYYAILPMLPELQRPEKDQPNAFKCEFSSADTVLDLAGTRTLLERYLLLPEQVDLASRAELLR
jgi:UDP-glucose 4-epimerase